VDGQRLQSLLQEIDKLVSQYLYTATAVELKVMMSGQVDVEELLEHGGFPPSDPRSRPGSALLAIASKLKDEGGTAQLAHVLQEYGQKYGASRAAMLNVRWHYLAEQ
jgi:hypothetical protein